MSRVYPDAVAGPYEPPPRSFTDAEGREVTIRRYDGDFESLAEMYDKFDPGDRAQGIPPSDGEQIRDWLETITTGEGVNVLAWHGDDVAGHATLVPEFGDGGQPVAYELAIFVLHSYQSAGIGSQLIEGLLGAGREDGVERVWLTVERWNNPAVALYEKVGFEPSDTGSFELEMAARLQ
ncbi:GNAT family N-acetyltransferase [Halosegnis sp.]|uniref:GNAT family N-acetyltransferase n=1 Tax=Halosegnis sp. TaxID=2864959 RepID=UPI0035D4A22C